MQEIFTQVWRRPHGFDSDRGSVRAYLFGIARKQAAEWWRKQRPSGGLVDKPTAPAAAESYSAMAEALGRLNVEQRKVGAHSSGSVLMMMISSPGDHAFECALDVARKPPSHAPLSGVSRTGELKQIAQEVIPQAPSPGK